MPFPTRIPPSRTTADRGDSETESVYLLFKIGKSRCHVDCWLTCYVGAVAADESLSVGVTEIIIISIIIIIITLFVHNEQVERTKL